MKKIILIFCSLILCLSLISCGTGNEEETPEETVKPMDDYHAEAFEKMGVTFDPQRSDLPSYEQFKQIKRGMRFEEVYALIGNPQNWDTARLPSNPMVSVDTFAMRDYLIYNTSDGKNIAVVLGLFSSDPYTFDPYALRVYYWKDLTTGDSYV